jgi:hypothetical protein
MTIPVATVATASQRRASGGVLDHAVHRDQHGEVVGRPVGARREQAHLEQRRAADHRHRAEQPAPSHDQRERHGVTAQEDQVPQQSPVPSNATAPPPDR